MQWKDMLIEAQSMLEYGCEGAALVDEYDEDGNLITILRYDDKQAIVNIQDLKNRRTGYHLIDIEMLKRLDYGNFERLLNELFYYAQPTE